MDGLWNFTGGRDDKIGHICRKTITYEVISCWVCCLKPQFQHQSRKTLESIAWRHHFLPCDVTLLLLNAAADSKSADMRQFLSNTMKLLNFIKYNYTGVSPRTFPAHCRQIIDVVLSSMTYISVIEIAQSSLRSPHRPDHGLYHHKMYRINPTWCAFGWYDICVFMTSISIRSLVADD